MVDIVVIRAISSGPHISFWKKSTPYELRTLKNSHWLYGLRVCSTLGEFRPLKDAGLLGGAMEK